LTTKETAPKTSGKPALPRPGDELDVAFTDLLANGQAVGRCDGAVVFCAGPLPGERARVTIALVKPKYAVAELRELLTQSPARVSPFCPVFGECGGCQLQHLDYGAQLRWKREALRGALERIGGFRGADVRETIGMAVPRHYRNKMSLVGSQRDGATAFGFYRQRSHEVVPIEACPIVTEQLSGYVGRLRALADGARGARGAAAEAFAEARHVTARSARASGEAVVTVTTARESTAVRDFAAELMATLPGAAGVTNSFELSSENAILGRKHRLLAGRAEIEESIGGVRYRVSAGSFFQVNVEIVGRIFEFLQPFLRAPRSIVDLYCGAGTFALFFAQHGCDVFGVEESPRAVAEARANAELNGLQARVAFSAGRVEQVLRDGAGRAALRGAAAAFLDPPRKGSDEAALGAIAAARVPEVWYLSCDPATLARDLKFLASKGYRLGAVQPFDMFPQTGHVEALAVLQRTDRHSE
jgi:23S rRNA (uracil1939-C5)-methyltransferase